MNFLLHLLVDAAVIAGLAALLPQVVVRNFGTAVLIALLLGLLNFVIGWVIRFPLNVVTFFLLTGLVRLFVTALLLKLIDGWLADFTIAGFWPALLIALAVSVAGSLIDDKAPMPPQYVEAGDVVAQTRLIPLV